MKSKLIAYVIFYLSPQVPLMQRDQDSAIYHRARFRYEVAQARDMLNRMDKNEQLEGIRRFREYAQVRRFKSDTYFAGDWAEAVDSFPDYWDAALSLEFQTGDLEGYRKKVLFYFNETFGFVFSSFRSKEKFREENFFRELTFKSPSSLLWENRQLRFQFPPTEDFN